MDPPYSAGPPVRRADGNGSLRPECSSMAADRPFSAERMARGTMSRGVGPRLDLLAGVLRALLGSAATAIGASRLAQSP
jgi:hypothetical protein